MLIVLVFFITLIISIAYHVDKEPTEEQRQRSKQNAKTAAQVAGVALVTTCVKLIKEKE